MYKQRQEQQMEALYYPYSEAEKNAAVKSILEMEKLRLDYLAFLKSTAPPTIVVSEIEEVIMPQTKTEEPKPLNRFQMMDWDEI